MSVFNFRQKDEGALYHLSDRKGRDRRADFAGDGVIA
jgi:hypothetical protein